MGRSVVGKSTYGSVSIADSLLLAIAVGWRVLSLLSNSLVQDISNLSPSHYTHIIMTNLDRLLVAKGLTRICNMPASFERPLGATAVHRGDSIRADLIYDLQLVEQFLKYQ